MVEFRYLVFACMPGKSVHRRFGSLLSSPVSDVFGAAQADRKADRQIDRQTMARETETQRDTDKHIP